MIGNHVYGFPVPRVQIPHSAPLRSIDFKVWDCYFCFTSKGFEPYAMFCGCYDNGVASKISISVATARSIEFCKNKIQIPHSAPLRSSGSRFEIATFILLQRDLNPVRCFAVATTTEWRAKSAYRLRLQGALNFVKTKFKSLTLRHRDVAVQGLKSLLFTFFD